MSANKKIVIYGGAFDPPHIGHAMVIDNVLRLFPCDEIWILPSGNRADKTIKVSKEHRFTMISLLLFDFFPNAKIPIIKVSGIETEQSETTITFQTKKKLQNLYPDWRFYFLITSELVGDIKTKWVKGEDLFYSTDFIVCPRAGYPLNENLPDNFVILDNEVMETNVSSTFVRNLLAKGHTGSPYIPTSAARYIKENQLYDSLNQLFQ
ncbi:MAG: nicotinate-nicotinamide nucleotide adenylyltransferase [Parcubacteria group bacterium]|nr:nicotinate-nicotinamide nucleotide adenylyltransferase [Parcubacteria group bacterium]